VFMGKRIKQTEINQILRERVVKRHSCKDNLYLNMTKSGTANWCMVYDFFGERKMKGLGAYDKVNNTLAMARARCNEYRVLIKRGIDPKAEEQRKLDLKRQQAEEAKAVDRLRENTFEKVTYELIEDRTSSWTDPKSPQQWTNTLKQYAFPIIGHLPVSEINSDHILEILRPIWVKKYPTAKKLRQRIEAIFSRAIYFKLRSSGNPATYKDNLEIPLPTPQNRQVEHLAALSYKELPQFMAELRERDGVAARALEFLILNANRTTEVRKARWCEFDFEKRQWSIPVDTGRLGKTKKPHIVPLSGRSMEILLALSDYRISEYVFPNTRSTNYLSNAGMDSVIKRMRKDRDWSDDFGKKITVHGFRSTMRDFIAEKTDFDRDTAEMILAHTAGNAVERAYRRGDLMEKRRRVMEYYSDYAYGEPEKKVIQLRAHASI